MTARALLLLALLPTTVLAFGLQEQAVGAHVAGSFELGQKRVYAPPGDWTLIARHTWTGTTDAVRLGTNFGGVYLAEIKDGRLTRAISAWGNVDPNLARGWRASVDPCKKREHVLAYNDLSANAENQFCYDVTELRGYMKKSTGWRQQAQQWLREHEVKLPPNMLVVRFGRLERAYWTEVFYYFDPKDLSAESAAKWAAEKAPMVRDGLAIPGP